ncbi:hypothetical protein V2J09_014095 [Rumex salicifolius]
MESCRKLIFLVTVLSLTLLQLTTTAEEMCHPDDKKSLLGIKTWVRNNRYFSSWIPDTDGCQGWLMVYCHPTTHHPPRRPPHRRRRPHHRHPPHRNHPPSVSHLPYLQNLTFRKLLTKSGPSLWLGWASARSQSNFFLYLSIYLDLNFKFFFLGTGNMPFSVASLRHLVSARFDHNALSGLIPAFFSRMTSLQYLDLSFNQFSGSVPQALAPPSSTVTASRARPRVQTERELFKTARFGPYLLITVSVGPSLKWGTSRVLIGLAFSITRAFDDVVPLQFYRLIVFMCVVDYLLYSIVTKLSDGHVVRVRID